MAIHAVPTILVADGHTVWNAPARPPKLSGTGPGSCWVGGTPWLSSGCCDLELFWFVINSHKGRGQRKRNNTNRTGTKAEESTRRRISDRWSREQQANKECQRRKQVLPYLSWLEHEGVNLKVGSSSLPESAFILALG